ncbi:phage neck terminator protein [Xenorhabdus szentirmaii]|uniref:Bacteriophage protein n=1 Tax=Xenorhabdus szentirmaii DSM 16338 TaxID=1427518 RepID=W1J7G8_9GAMM|nr:hypothetical protein [Xenorhabdus szentirmaii]PHM32005.1 bacteriophage protein [Xenorhabdus szentirmaii DSM 16338]CDL85410.1 putative bacteriophage protein [Xenorhabdus szentirmaii DSM 16338]
MNSSEQAGWLIPNNELVYDEALERLLSQWLRGLSGLSNGMVRPRWTPVPVAQPSANTDWCGFSISEIPADDNPAFANQMDEHSELWRHEEIECSASFYGPRSQGYASRFRDGLGISQNNAELNLLGLSVVKYSRITSFPEFINNQWVRRYDITVTLRRKVIRRYSIKSLTSVPIKFFGD